MIEIDYAGSRSFIGGTFIGTYRPEINAYYFDIIPVELYNKENFKKLYLDEVANITSRAFKVFCVSNHSRIAIHNMIFYLSSFSNSCMASSGKSVII